MNRTTHTYAGAIVMPKNQSLVMRAFSWLFPHTARYWTTARMPFGKPTIYYPSSVSNPLEHTRTLRHELVHVAQQRTAWGLFKSFWLAWLLPLPILFSGRWLIERDAWLLDVKALGGSDTAIAAAVTDLWEGYLWPWPRRLMYDWFKRKINETNTQGSVPHMTG